MKRPFETEIRTLTILVLLGTSLFSPLPAEAAVGRFRTPAIADGAGASPDLAMPTPTPVVGLSPRGHVTRPFVPSAPTAPSAASGAAPAAVSGALASALTTAGASDAASEARFATFPRPPQDNGWGVHWLATPFQPNSERLDYLVAEAKSLGVKWVKILVGDEPKLDQDYLVRALVRNGMMPVVRVYQPVNEPYRNLEKLVSLGVPAGAFYYELFNEPNIAGPLGGWRPGEPISVDKMVGLWIPAADAVIRAGGLPSLPPPSPGGDYDDVLFLKAFLDGVAQRGRADLLQKSWIAVHNYFLNHPVDYPYDSVNLLGTPLSAAEIALRKLTPDQVARISAARGKARLPRSQGGYFVGETIFEDSNAFLKFLAYEKVFEERFGYQIPIISTEGGASAGAAEDPRYPPVTDDDVTRGTLYAYNYMLEKAPAYYFAFMPWILANRLGDGGDPTWEAAAWYKADGATLPVVPALKQNQDKGRVRGLPSADGVIAASVVPADLGWVNVREEQVTIPTYQLAGALVGTAVDDPVYPYHRLDFARVGSAVPQVYRAIVLENPYVALTVLPELGGRLYRWVDKATGRNLLYENPVVKPTQWGERGWWLAAGGMEWTFPVAEHGLNEYSPWTYSVEKGTSTVSVTVRDVDKRGGLAAAITIALDATHSYFSLRPSVSNPTAQAQAFQFWVNAMMRQDGDPGASGWQVTLPTPWVRVQSSATSALVPRSDVPWPVLKEGEVDQSWLRNWPSYQSFFESPAAQGDFLGLYDVAADQGMARIFPSDVARGVQVSAMPGLNPAQWTDGDSRYVTLRGGVTPDTWSTATLLPGETVEWTEQWYPLRGLGSFDYANQSVALSLSIQVDGARVSVAATSPLSATVVVWHGGEAVGQYAAELSPARPFVQRVAGASPQRWGVQVLGQDGRTLASWGLVGTTFRGPTPLRLAATPVMTGTVSTPVHPAPTVAVVDPRLAKMGVTVVPAPTRSGQTHFVVKKLAYQDENESGGSHHIYVEVLDEEGRRLTNQSVAIRWQDSQVDLVTSNDKPVTEYAANFAMYGALGAYSAQVAGGSDKVIGMGLPGRLHVNYLITFQRVRG